MSYKNYPMVSRVIYGRGSFNQLNEILAPKRLSSKAPFIFLVDDVFKGKSWLTSRIPLAYEDKLHYISAKEEPKTSQVDELVEQIILTHKERPSGIIGIGGGIQHLAKDKKSSWGVSYNYTNLLLGFAINKQKQDFFQIPVYHQGDANFRIKTKNILRMMFTIFTAIAIWAIFIDR